MDRTPSPDLTVVTPSYNQGGFIEETIRSVLEQQGVSVEYLIMDGGSTDDTLAILKKYEGQLEFVSEKDKGQTAAINKGFRRARGRIVAYLNSDDIYLPGAISRAVRFMDAHPEYAMAYGEGYHIDSGGRILERYYTEPFDFERLAEICFICQPTVFLRREVFSTVGYLDESLHFCLDYDFWIRVAKHYSVGYIPAYLAATRLHDEAKTLAKKFEFHKEILANVKKHYGHVPARWISAYAHASLERHISRQGKLKDSLFRILVYSLFGLKYLLVNHKLPLSDFMTRLNRPVESESEFEHSTP